MLSFFIRLFLSLSFMLSFSFAYSLTPLKKPQEIVVVGTGYVGLVCGTCLAEIGHKVTCCDVDFHKICALQRGEIPIYETGLESLIAKNTAEHRLFFTTSLDEAIQQNSVIIVTVGTPETPNGEANLDYVFAVGKLIGENLYSSKTIFVKSTVPIGTVLKLKEIINENNHYQTPFSIGYTPEFLREGSSVNDFMHPDRIVVGAEDAQTSASFADIIQPILDGGATLCTTSIPSAEMIKYAANSFLAVKISFINEIANFCEKIGADVEQVALGVGLDKRIGQSFLKPGPGYGGSCFPKDTLAFLKTAQNNDVELAIVQAAVSSNCRRCDMILSRLENALGTFENKKIALLGLAFKEQTDDVRESPSLKIIDKITQKKGSVKSYDPVATHNALKFYPHLDVTDSLYEVFEDCDAIVVATPWKLFTQINWKRVKEISHANLVFDTRNILDPFEIQEAGFNYIRIGKK